VGTATQEQINSVLEILGQSAAPDGDTLVQLQERLAEAGYFEGGTYPNFGPKTTDSIISFISENPDAAGRVGNWAMVEIQERGRAGEIQQAVETGAEQISDAQQMQAENALTDLLSKQGQWNNTEQLEVQASLSRLGVDYGRFDGDVGPRSSAAITEYIADHPDLLAQVSDETFMHLIRNGQGDELQQIVQGDPVHQQIIDQRIDGILDKVDNNAANLQWQDTYELQTLMALTGDNSMHNIDGVYGGQTETAITQYQTRISMEAVGAPPEKPDTLPDQPAPDAPAAAEPVTADPVAPTTVPPQQVIPPLRPPEPGTEPDSAADTDAPPYIAAPPVAPLAPYDGLTDEAVETAWSLTRLQASISTVWEAQNLVEQDPSMGLIADGRIADLIAKADGDPYALPEQDVSELQHLLAVRGDNPPHNIDGAMGGTTLSAIESFTARTEGEELTTTSRFADPDRPLIVIDLGHGAILDEGNPIDEGAVSPHNNLSEMDVVDRLGPEIAEELEAQGYNVAFTRDPGEILRIQNDYGDTLESRAEFAHSLANITGAGNVTFLSLHFDSAGPHADDPRIYIRGSAGQGVSELDGDLAARLSDNYRLGDEETTQRLGNYSVLRQFDERTPDGAPAHSGGLLELGFGSNAENAADLQRMYDNPDPDAREIATGLIEHIEHKHQLAGLDMPARSMGQPAPEREGGIDFSSPFSTWNPLMP